MLTPMQNGDASPHNGSQDTPTTNAQIPHQRPPPPIRKAGDKKYSSELTQARQIQNIAHKLVASMENDIVALPASPSPKSAAAVRAARRSVAVSLRMAVMAWETACDRVRIARGKPLPGSLRPEPIAKRKPTKQSATSFSEQPETKTSETTTNEGG